MARLLTLFITATVFTASSCTETRVVNDPWGDLPIDRPNDNNRDRRADPYAANTPATPQAMDTWAIALASFEGEDAEPKARNFLHALRDAPALRQTWTEWRNERLIVYEGRFIDPLSDRAQRHLARVRETSVQGKLLLGGVKFVSLANFEPAQESTAVDALDLKSFVGMYSLQIGFYDEQYGENFREAAEQAAQTLRDQGEQAFYYHGPTVSMITLGLFTEEDLSSQAGITVYSPRITAIQERFPFNLANGKTLVEKIGGQRLREQPSFLVRVH